MARLPLTKESVRVSTISCQETTSNLSNLKPQNDLWLAKGLGHNKGPVCMFPRDSILTLLVKFSAQVLTLIISLTGQNDPGLSIRTIVERVQERLAQLPRFE